MDGQEDVRDSVHNSHAASETFVVKELFPNAPLKMHSSSWNTENPNSLPNAHFSSWDTRYDNLAKRRRIESDPGGTNAKWLSGQSPPSLYNAENETPAWVINHNCEAKYIDEDGQTKTRRYSHSYRSGTAFDRTEEEDKRPVGHYSPTKSSNRTELAAAGRQLVSYDLLTSPPLPRKYYYSARINDRTNASATCANVPNIFTNDKSTGLVASRDLEAQNIPSSTISKDEPTGFAAHRGKQAQGLPRPLEMNRNTNNDSWPSRKRKREMDENFQTPVTPAKPLTPIARSLIAVAQNSPHRRALQKARDSVSNSIQKNVTISSSPQHTNYIVPFMIPDRKSNATNLTPSNARRSVRIQPAQTFVHSPTVYINQMYKGLAVDICHHTEELARWERESLAKGFDQAQAEHWLLVIDIQLLIGRLVALCETHPVVDVQEPRLLQMSCGLQSCFDILVDRSNVFIEMNEEEAAKAKAKAK